MNEISTVPLNYLGDAHEWMNEISTVPLNYLGDAHEWMRFPQSLSTIWRNHSQGNGGDIEKSFPLSRSTIWQNNSILLFIDNPINSTY